MRAIVAIDQGTTGTTVLVLDEELRVLGRHTQDFRQHFPRPGWVEHDPHDIWKSVLVAVGAALAQAKISSKEIGAIGITNQRETTVIWDRVSGEPVHNALVWQDRRTADACQLLRDAGHENTFRQRTGLVIDPYFSGTKIAWLLENVEGCRAGAERGDLHFGTIDSYLISQLSKRSCHVTDVSNASRTLLFDIHALDWSSELLSILQIPPQILPKVMASSGVAAFTQGVPGLPDGIPIAGIAGDQQAALFGQMCFSAGQAKCTYGTGAFVLLHVGAKPVASHHNLLSTVAWKLPDNSVAYALEGSAFIAGAAVQWLRDGLGIIKQSAEIEALARSVDDSAGVTFVPAFTGLGAPHWNPHARAEIVGMTRGTTKAHIARACLEAIALQVNDLLHAMEKDTGKKIELLRVDGGACANDLLMQMQADFLNSEISRPSMLETTALGAALLAGHAVGIWPRLSDVSSVWREAKRFTPAPNEQTVSVKARWQRAIDRMQA